MRRPGIQTTRFKFKASVPMHEVMETMLMAQLAIESIYGEDRAKLETSIGAYPRRRLILIGTANEIGVNLALVFMGYMRREFGGRSFTMERSRLTEIPAA